MNNIDITPRNEKSQAHGYWETYWDGRLWYRCYYLNDILTGYEEYYFTNNKKFEVTFYL